MRSVEGPCSCQGFISGLSATALGNALLENALALHKDFFGDLLGHFDDPLPCTRLEASISAT